MFHALAFGLGTFAAGMVVIGAAGGLAARLPARLLGGQARGRIIYRKVCGVILMGGGLWLLLA